jgi:very-short-patch-repair endonuclease
MLDNSTDTATVTTANIQATVGTTVNLADHQNSVPLLKELSVTNASAATVLEQLELRVFSEPAFFKTKSWRIEAIPAQESLLIPNIDMVLDGALLSRLTEAEQATITFVLLQHDRTDNNAEPSELCREVAPIELLPRNQWGGLSYLPEMVAAFVQPNEPAVEKLLKKTAEVLREHNCDPAINGYQGGAKHAWELTSALWAAIAGMGLDYALPPSSFEERGQKIRGPQQVLESGLATCLDTALLFCAALEQAGLNPLVIFTKGHAFAGVWLKPEEFSTPVIDDITALRKRVSLKELVLFETTLVTRRPAPSFDIARDHGARKISETEESDFQVAIDVRRARLQRIKPLALGIATPVVSAPADMEVTSAPVFISAPDDLPEDDTKPPEEERPQTPQGRLDRWQRKLLDLSLRNNLLNFRSGVKTLRLEAPDPGALEDLLSSGQGVKLLPRPELMDGRDPRAQSIHEGRTLEDLRQSHARDALQRKEVFVDLAAADVDARLTDLYRSTKTAMQESGSNTLFLALGFLSWTKDKDQEKTYRAPLILVPVSLQRQSIRSGFSLTIHDDEPRFNPTLVEMLRQDFQLNLGISEHELPKDDAGLNVAEIWKKVSGAIKNIPGWEVKEDVVLSSFSFAKHLMWKDLVERTDQLRTNAVVRHLLDTPREAFPSSTEFPAPKRLDTEYAPEKIFCPLPADSSQLSAVMAASQGKDFVLIGPPGTGKSQTIANLIAQSLAEGKRVLFVSEKIAALDVVYRRLREVGLGNFCLELHSNKASKSEILSQLKTSWDTKGAIDDKTWRRAAEKLHIVRQQLNKYVEKLHHIHSNGMTLYQAIGIVTSSENIKKVAISWPSPTIHDEQSKEKLSDAVKQLRINYQEIDQLGAYRHTKLPLIEQTNWSPAWQDEFTNATQKTLDIAKSIRVSANQLIDGIQLPSLQLTSQARVTLEQLAKLLPHAVGRDWCCVLQQDPIHLSKRLKSGADLIDKHTHLSSQLSPAWSPSTLSESRQALEFLKQYQALKNQLPQAWSQTSCATLSKGLEILTKIKTTQAELSTRYDPKVDDINVTQLYREWKKVEKSLWPISWLRQRKISKVIESLAIGDAPPNVASDIRILAEIHRLKSDLSALPIGPEISPIWQGLKTQTAIASSALTYQSALQATHNGKPWIDRGLEAIASGQGGKDMSVGLEKLRAIQVIERDLTSLGTLRSAMPTFWKSISTDLSLLQATEQFQTELINLRYRGYLQNRHELIGSGACGASMANDYKIIGQRSGIEKELNDYDDLQSITDHLWSGLDTSVDEVKKSLVFFAHFPGIVRRLGRLVGDAQAVENEMLRILSNREPRLHKDGAIISACTKYCADIPKLQTNFASLSKLGSISHDNQKRLFDKSLDELISNCENLRQNEPRLKAWCAWRKACHNASTLGMDTLVKAVEDGLIPNELIDKTFETNYARWWLESTFNQDQELCSFVSAEHEERIIDFKTWDDRYTALTRSWVRARLCGELPNQENIPRNSEWGVLRKEMTKKRNHIPLRSLMEQIPSALTKLVPCLLMSPLSIAQYLSTQSTPFDLVVFDEASQIPVWDAIGAIARGKQVVMVGDPKQLPPTNFFNRGEVDSDDEDIEADMESILDECIGANLPCRELSWHYRSRHESLIAFSNHHYYGGSLVTFPSPVTNDKAVSLHAVQGIYAKGGARTNQIEAKALVADLVGRLKSPGFSASKLTVGVVTFNGEQQRLVEDLLDAERRKDPSIEPFFADTELEPVFVKNLESVQGDERDIMYFSITYGPDLSGVILMNFGPMNRGGGERRLNVAITRARHELRVFSSLQADQIDLGRTQAQGVKDLKHFLDFAQRGPSSLGQAIHGSQGGYESPFEQAVADALTRKGWQLHTQVGVSVFRIDLAVVHPDAPGLYLTGIECDGATYHRSATAKDRDKLREQVLRGLGWEIVRIWSTDWWLDKESALAKVHARLEALLAASRSQRAIEAAVSVTIAPPNATPHVEPPAQDGVKDSSPIYASRVPDPQREETLAVAEDFFDPAYTQKLRQMISRIVQTDGPILEAVVVRQIAREHGWQRAGNRIQQHVLQLAEDMFERTSEPEIGTFLWPKHLSSNHAIPFRSSTPENTRAVHEICLQELISLAKTWHINITDTDMVISAMAQELGIKRLTAQTRQRLLQAVHSSTS